MEVLDPEGQRAVEELERKLAYAFKDRRLAFQALTHSSAKDKDRPCNERLEFLGDSIVGQIVSEYLFENLPDRNEGDLSMMKSILVSSKTLAELARELELDKSVLVGRGLAKRRVLPRSILCNSLEAMVAALHLDGGGDVARRVILSFMQRRIQEILQDQYEKNYKSILQDFAQKIYAAVPQYKVLKEMGPDHKKMFQILVELPEHSFGPAWGSSKKEAEQNAARLALEGLGLLAPAPSAESSES